MDSPPSTAHLPTSPMTPKRSTSSSPAHLSPNRWIASAPSTPSGSKSSTIRMSFPPSATRPTTPVGRLPAHTGTAGALASASRARRSPLGLPPRNPDGSGGLAYAPNVRWIQGTSSGVGRTVEALGLLDSDLLITTARGVPRRPAGRVRLPDPASRTCASSRISPTFSAGTSGSASAERSWREKPSRSSGRGRWAARWRGSVEASG